MSGRRTVQLAKCLVGDMTIVEVSSRQNDQTIGELSSRRSVHDSGKRCPGAEWAVFVKDR